MNKENCALKLVDEIILYCDARSKNIKLQKSERRLPCSLLSSDILYRRLQRVVIPDAVIIKSVLLKMGMLMLETCRG